ncbi:MAG TPA: UDP-N-acetylmuramoyl-tripeptide--D-alanyl-D-alanine ligase [Mycobacterium sp.]|nr:UDP-N-acetylmuramoyl-tripeptide--D-alanyl-D-alanine ligase [Mycobacterium sp.]
MIPLTIARIAEIVGGTLADITPAEAAQRRVTGTVEFDSRAVTEGGLFLALPGARADGHDFAAAAVEAGAVAVLAARPVGVPAIVVPAAAASDAQSGAFEHDTDGSGAAVLAALAKLASAVAAELVEGGLTIIGLTGSSGKTSTKDLIAAVLRPLGEVVAPPGSFNNELGHPWTVLRAGEDTDFLVLEMSARHPGNIAALAAIARPSIAAVLNVGTAHLGEFGSREIIAETKSELVQALPVSGVAVLNADDPLVAAMDAKTVARVVRVGRAGHTAESTMRLRNEAEEERGDRGLDVRAENIELDELARPRFTMVTATGRAEVQLAVHGEHQVSNALSAAAIALECGASLPQVAEALAGAGPTSRHRMEVRVRADGVTVINDAYNANPESMRAGLQALAVMARQQQNRSWAVLGEMGELGDESITEHDRVGRLAVRLDISRLVVVGTGRPMSAMHHGAVMEGSWGSESVMVPDADAALALLRAELQPGDVVLVKASNAAGLGALAEALAESTTGPEAGAERGGQDVADA